VCKGMLLWLLLVLRRWRWLLIIHGERIVRLFVHARIIHDVLTRCSLRRCCFLTFSRWHRILIEWIVV
jgi:hypothetical protein